MLAIMQLETKTMVRYLRRKHPCYQRMRCCYHRCLYTVVVVVVVVVVADFHCG